MNFGDFLDFETCLSIKDFCQNNSYKFLTTSTFFLNKDFRSIFGLTNSNFLDINLDEIEFYNYIIVNSNSRFESPILNLKIRKIFSNFENKIFIVGFISNFNFNFKHIDIFISKLFLNFNLQNEKNIILSSNSFSYFKNFNFISKNISLMALNDLNFIFFKNLKKSNYFKFNIGQPENCLFYSFSFFNVNLFHHIEEEFFKIYDSYLTVLLPSSFYFEKATTYSNNFFNFFNLLNHFSIKIPNTKPE